MHNTKRIDGDIWHARTNVVHHQSADPGLLSWVVVPLARCKSLQLTSRRNRVQVILKPAESTPLTAFALAELARRAGFPSGTLNMLTGDPAKISAHIDQGRTHSTPWQTRC